MKATRSAIVMHLRPASFENASSLGVLAIEPSLAVRSTISQSSPAGLRPARRERSTAASVCPGRERAPPGWARRGKMWPGRRRSEGSVVGLNGGGEDEVEASSPTTTTSPPCVPPARSLIVLALSAAEIPVEIPSAASTVTVNAVRIASSLRAGGTISGSARRSQAGPGSPTHSTPDVSSTMKAILDVVAASAARIRSPSFSLSASSRTTTNSPRATASKAEGIESKPGAGCGGEKSAGQRSGVEGGDGESASDDDGKSESATPPMTSTLLLPIAGGAMALARAEERGGSVEEDEGSEGEEAAAAAAAADRFVAGLRKKREEKGSC